MADTVTGVNVQVNLTDWKSVAHSLRILAASFESIEHGFDSGCVGRVESPDGTSCGGWVVTD